MRRTRQTPERLGRHIPPGQERGLVVVQVDGLSYETLKRAFRLRFMPRLKRLMRRRGYFLRRCGTGLPATTPVHHAAAFYGDSSVVPGFRWFDREAGRLRTMKNPFDARETEDKLAARSPGALAGGSAYVTMFQGGARHSGFTSSGTEFGSLTTTLPAWDVFAFAVANAPVFARIGLRALYELLLEIWDHAVAILRAEPRRSELGFLVERVIANAVIREIVTAAVCLDVHQGLPVVWANFLGYDAMSHHRGPRSLRALIALRGIDRCVRTIERAARKSSARAYDLLVLSDHGQVPAVPFERVHGEDFRTWFVEHASLPGASVAVHERQNPALPVMQLLSAVRHVRDLLPWPLRGLARTLDRRLELRVRRWEKRLGRGQTLSDVAEAYVAPTGGMAHVYLTTGEAPVEIDDVERTSPGLVEALTRLDGIRAVAGRLRRGGTVVLSEAGRRWRERQGTELRLDGEDPLEGTGPPAETFADVERLLSLPDAGDLLVFGGRLKGRRLRRRYLNFLEEFGAHGGLEPLERDGFMVGPGSMLDELSAVKSPADLYPILRRRTSAKASARQAL